MLHPVAGGIDEAAFAALLHEQRARLLALLRRLCGRDAEDVLQDTLTKVWRLRHTFDARGNATAWLTQAALHTLCDHRQRRRRDVQPAAEPPEPDAPREAPSLELREEVALCLEALPPLERELLVGFHAQGLSLRELAARHALPLNTVKSHLHRARLRLARSHRDDDAR